jgi:arylsulfatase A-like enzyme
MAAGIESSGPHGAARCLRAGLLAIAAVGLLGSCSVSSDPAPPADSGGKPNILMILLDDVGIDQWRSFSYGGPVPAAMPAMDAVAENAIKFVDTWSMPSCSAGRATIFTGRYPQRTGVVTAFIARQDLAVSQVSPYEVTLPKVLATAGYQSAMFGKFHMGGRDNNPDGLNAPVAQGWNYFSGVLQEVDEIDTSAGGVAPQGTYRWGFVDDAKSGACYFSNGGCENFTAQDTGDIVGRRCMERGGLLVKDAVCQASRPANLDFTLYNGYYTWPKTVSGKGIEATAEVFRGYHETESVNEAVNWIRARNTEKAPWFAVLSTVTVHTPYQPPPRELEPGWALPGPDCGTLCADRITGNSMIAAADREIGRLLVSAGIARRNAAGGIDYDPAYSNTMIIVTADNGSWSSIVKLPFDLTRSKGTPYQTGVWVPLFVAGPKVAPALVGSSNTNPANAADLYRLVAEIAGVEVDKLVPSGQLIDAKSMIGYLKEPGRVPGVTREVNFSEQGVARKAPTTTIYACVIQASNFCIDAVFDTKALCTGNGGIWYGPDGDGAPNGYRTCCDVRAAVPNSTFAEQPLYSRTVRRNNYKLVEQSYRNCSTRLTEAVLELYQIDNKPVVPLLDRLDLNLLAAGTALSSTDQSNLDILKADLKAIVDSEAACPGDGNLDKVVDAADLEGYEKYKGLGSTVYDLNFDAKTDDLDLQIIRSNLGADCRITAAR